MHGLVFGIVLVLSVCTVCAPVPRGAHAHNSAQLAPTGRCQRRRWWCAALVVSTRTNTRRRSRPRWGCPFPHPVSLYIADTVTSPKILVQVACVAGTKEGRAEAQRVITPDFYPLSSAPRFSMVVVVVVVFFLFTSSRCTLSLSRSAPFPNPKGQPPS